MCADSDTYSPVDTLNIFKYALNISFNMGIVYKYSGDISNNNERY